jgi:hypothetical protein
MEWKDEEWQQDYEEALKAEGIPVEPSLPEKPRVSPWLRFKLRLNFEMLGRIGITLGVAALFVLNYFIFIYLTMPFFCDIPLWPLKAHMPFKTIWMMLLSVPGVIANQFWLIPPMIAVAILYGLLIRLPMWVVKGE